ncbi:MAG: SurA N-terminal domain-containing protein [Nitrosomonadales bacterium]
MLEKIRDSLEKKWAKVVLVIIVVPFALFGIDSYLNSIGRNVNVARVNGVDISAQEFQKSFDMIQERYKDNPEVLQTKEFKLDLVNSIVNNQVVMSAVKENQFTISNEQLSKYIVNMPDFQVNGKFSQERYDEIVKYNGLTPKKLEDQIRLDLSKQQFRDTLPLLLTYPEERIKNLANIAYEKRKVRIHEILSADIENKISVTNDDITKFYNDNESSFIRPDQVKIEFVVYSVANIVPSVNVTDSEVKDFYETNKSNYHGDEERSASHILLLVDDKSKELEVKQKAEELLTQIKKDPKKFNEFAKKYSQDTESAKNNGSLGFFKRGIMVKPFEEEVFKLNKGDISNLVKSDFGYHIIRLDDVKGKNVTLNDVKAQIKGELLYQKALEIYNANAEEFSNLVYEKSDSLKPVIDKFKLDVQSSPWLSHQDAESFFKNPLFAKAIFDKNLIDKKLNSSAIEVSPNNLVSARVIDFRKSEKKPLGEVSNDIKSFLIKKGTQEKLIEEGNKLVEALKVGSSKKISWVDDLTIDRSDKKGLSDSVADAIFKMNKSQLPTYTGLYDPKKGEFQVIELYEVAQSAINEGSYDVFKDEFDQALHDEIDSAYINFLRSESSIKINNKFINN